VAGAKAGCEWQPGARRSVGSRIGCALPMTDGPRTLASCPSTSNSGASGKAGEVQYTDGWTGYRNLGKFGYTHRVTNPSKSPGPAHVLMPGVHRIAALLKRWLLGTFQGAVSNDHLNYCLDEYTFRFNRRSSMSRGLLFDRLLEQAVQTDHTPTYERFLGTGRAARQD